MIDFHFWKRALAAPTTISAVESLARTVAGKGHPRFRFLSPTYSPGSRCPCCDFTPWIADRLASGDISSLKALFLELVAGNPGLGFSDGSWTGEVVEAAAFAPFERYVTFASPTAMNELRAVVMLYGLDGSASKSFEIASRHVYQLASIIACQCPTWRPEMAEVADRANAFIKKMRRELQFWREFPLFKSTSFETRIPTGVDVTLQTLAPSSRLAIFTIASRGPVRFASCVNNPPFGQDEATPLRELRNAELLEMACDEGASLALWDKPGLLEICTREGIPHKEGWKKSRLLEAIQSANPDLVRERMKSHAPVTVSTAARSAVLRTLAYGETLRTACSLLLTV
jgi:hypothetical protein